MIAESLIYQQVILGILVLLFAVTVMNVLFFRPVDRSRMPGAAPFVSVLLPARNEEDTIGPALVSLAEQDYPDYEVLVLDDNSTDTTRAIADSHCGRDPRFRLVDGKPLPPDWAGKAFACHQLAEEARGDLLLFVDADTVHDPHSIRAAVAELQRARADLITLIPHQAMESFWEKLLLPLLHFVTFAFLPMPLVSVTRSPSIAMANGQFMLFRREAYQRIGGHAAVRTALVEDVWLARRIKLFGYRLAIRDGAPVVSCRMYRSLGAVWSGFSKNLFAGFHYSVTAFAVVALFLLMTSVTPYAFAAAGLMQGEAGDPVFRIIASQVVLATGSRLLIDVRFRSPVWSSLLHPVAMLLLLGIAVNSCRWVLFSGGARWKGRVYDFRHRSPV